MKIEKIRTDSYSILKISKYDFLVKLIKEIGNIFLSVILIVKLEFIMVMKNFFLIF